MGTIRPDEREDLILKTIERIDGIGFNQLQQETGVPRKTLSKYLKDLEDSKVITKIKAGKKQNSRVRYIVNFSDHTKEAIKHNLGEIAKYNQWYTDKKLRKSNTFPHYLQELSVEYYSNMMSFLFDSIHAYKFGVKRLEELLYEEKKRLDKQFKGKSKAILWEACQIIQTELSFNASNSIYYAANRNNHRTRDEIIIDCANPHELKMGTQEERLKKMRAQGMIGNFSVEKNRVDYITDKKLKKLFIELADEYDRLSSRLSTIKYRLAGITGAYPFEPK